MVNRTGPLAAGYSLESETLWGLSHNAWTNHGRPRLWQPRHADGIFVGNPPYSWDDIQGFCDHTRDGLGPIIGILPASLGTRPTRHLIKRAGGTTLAVFRARSCAFIPHDFFTGNGTRGTADRCRMQRRVILAGWRMPPVSEAAQQELNTLAQAASHSHLPVFEAGLWKNDASFNDGHWHTNRMRNRDRREPGTAALAKRREDRIAKSRSRLSDKQRELRDAAIAKNRDKANAGDLDVSILATGPWASLCWWRKPEHWMPADLDIAQQGTARRMMRWGMIPRSFDHLLQFVGVTKEARRKFTGRIEIAVREAAASCVWAGRQHQRTDRTATRSDTTQEAATGPATPRSRPGDRGEWTGAPTGDRLATQQLARMQSRLTAATADSEIATGPPAEAWRSAAAPGTFSRCGLRDSAAGGDIVAAAGGSNVELLNFQRQTAKANGRGWATLPRWWDWSDERHQRHGTRFHGIVRASDGVCQSRTDGLRCTSAGFTAGHKRRKCAPCRDLAASKLGPLHLSCDICGSQPQADSMEKWTACGQWQMLCPHCTKATSAKPPSALCDCCGVARVVTATADGSGACADCADSFSQGQVWLARAQALCTRARTRLGLHLGHVTQSGERELWLHAARAWRATSPSFCGNAVTWRTICTTVAEWWAAAGDDDGRAAISVARHGGPRSRDRPATWETPMQPPPRAPHRQRTLTEMGVTGRTLRVMRPLHNGRRRRHTPTPAPTPPTPRAVPAAPPAAPARQIAAEAALDALRARAAAAARARSRRRGGKSGNARPQTWHAPTNTHSSSTRSTRAADGAEWRRPATTRREKHTRPPD